MSAEKVREFYRRQGEERAIKRIITRLEEHNCPEVTVFACDCGTYNEAIELIVKNTTGRNKDATHKD